MWGITPDGELGVFLRKIAPTIRFVASTHDLKLLRQAEWDAVVQFGDPPTDPRWEKHLRVVQFGGSSITGYMVPNPTSWVEVAVVPQSVATEFVISDEISDEVRRIVSVSLLPWLQSRIPNSVIGQHNTGFASRMGKVIHPFIADADGRPLAGQIKVSGQEWWWLPADAPDKDIWIVTAFHEWSNSDPSRFPPEPVWVQRSEWQTKEERNAVSALEELREEQSKVLADFQTREQDLTRQYEESRGEARSP